VRALLEQVERSSQLIASQSAVLALKEGVIKNAHLKIDALTLELAHHRRMRFAHKNEAFSSEQRDLFQETWNTDLAAMETELEQVKKSLVPDTANKPSAKREGAGRHALPEHLERIIHRHEPVSCQCGKCGQELKLIGEDISEQLDVVPARFFVHRHIRPQYACRACETVTAAPVPPAIIMAAWPP
jgi:transposase